MHKLKVKTIKTECVSCGEKLVDTLGQMLGGLLFNT